MITVLSLLCKIILNYAVSSNATFFEMLFFLESIEKNVFGKNLAISRQDKFVYSLNTVTMIIVNNNQQKKVMVK